MPASASGIWIAGEIRAVIAAAPGRSMTSAQIAEALPHVDKEAIKKSIHGMRERDRIANVSKDRRRALYQLTSKPFPTNCGVPADRKKITVALPQDLMAKARQRFVAMEATNPRGVEPEKIAGHPGYDTRFQLPPGTRVLGGFATAGLGINALTGRPW